MFPTGTGLLFRQSLLQRDDHLVARLLDFLDAFRIERLEPRWAMDSSASALVEPVQPTTGVAFELPTIELTRPEPVSTRRFASSERVDTNQDNLFSARDALVVIDALARSEDPSARLDVNNDGHVSALDALVLINELQRAGDQPLLLPVSQDDVDSQRPDASNFVSNLSSDVLPDDEMVDVVTQDFARITASYSDLGIYVYAPSPGSVFVYLTAQDIAAYDAGEFHRLDDLNAELLSRGERHIDSRN